MTLKTIFGVFLLHCNANDTWVQSSTSLVILRKSVKNYSCKWVVDCKLYSVNYFLYKPFFCLIFHEDFLPRSVLDIDVWQGCKYASASNIHNSKTRKKQPRWTRSSCSKLFFKIGVRKFRNFHRKAPVLNSLLNKVAGLLSCLRFYEET